MILLNDCLVGNSRVPTKVNKNISTDLQEVGSDGKYTRTSKEVQTGSEIFLRTFLNFPTTAVCNPYSA